MRIKLSQRILPNYTKGEEIFHMVSHIVGGVFAFVALILCITKSAAAHDAWALTGSIVYGIFTMVLYLMSSIYHGLKISTGKKVMQVMDHCAIYFMIAGTYTPIALTSLRVLYPTLAWTVLIIEWVCCAVAVTLTAIDLKKYQVFSMVCYIVMGWCVAGFFPQAFEVLTSTGFYFLLAGGIFYTVGAILYGIGKKKRYAHSVFHIFVLLGSITQFVAIFGYVL